MKLNKDLKLNTKLFDKNVKKASTREGYGDGVVEAGEKDPNVVVLCADLTDSTKSRKFADKFPKRFFNVGVAEQNLAGVAAGMGLSGKVAFMASYAVFSPGRNWEQIKVSICYSHANVKIVSSHAGLSMGPDGATHQGLEDIALTRVIPNMTVLSPADYYEGKKMTLEAAKHQGPVYIRLTRPKTPIITTEQTPFKIGKALIITEGSDLTICATGPMLYDALMAAHQLQQKQNISCEVVNVSTIKPLDEETIINSAKKTGKVITVEDHQIIGGLGSAIAETLSKNLPTPLRFVGVQDTFGESGTPVALKHKYKIDSDYIYSTALSFVK